VIEFGAESEYHGLQARLTRRFGQRFTANVGYTLSKALDHVDADNNAIGYSFDLDREWGPSGLDRRHQLTIDYVYQLPDAGTKWVNNAVGRVVLDGWQIAGISRFWSGQPLTITSGQDRNFDGLTTDRADLIGNPELDSGRPREELIEQWFNTAAFAQPAIGQDGTAGRSIVEGPGIRNVDLGVFRNVRLGSRVGLQLRLEATNVLNIVNFQNPGTGLNAAATFGKIRLARDMRRIQLGARVSF
jgi:hypothetical protein